jgi:Domain of Unknown Function (DUF1206)
MELPSGGRIGDATRPRARGVAGANADDWHERIGRVGFVALGVVYGIVGVIAVLVALGGESKTKDQTGALRELAGEPFGTVLLGALAIGLAAYAIYRLIEVFTGSETEEGKSDKVERAASVVRFVIYTGLCVSAVRIITDTGGGGGNPSQTTSTVFDLPAGAALVLIAGLIMIGVGAFQAYRAVSLSFTNDLEIERMGERTRKLTKPLGAVGHGARAVVFALVGAFLIKAAVEHESKEAIGLDGALREIAQQAYGSVLLVIAGVGLLLYGAYSVVEARYRKL